MEDFIDVLETVDIFKDLDRKQLASIAGRCRLDRYRRRQIIFSYQEHSADVYFIKSGRVGITMFSESGKEISFRQMKPGDLFGGIAAIDRLPRSASAVSQSNLELLRLSDTDFLEVLREMPDVAFRLMQHLTFLVRALSERVIEFTTHGVRNRIHAELLRIAKASGQETEVINIYPAPTHSEIASLVNTHREAVTREFGHLASEGVLEKRGRNLIIRDIARLERLVNEGG
ncbi:MAG: Crp/Fnr family transcriptional regulator [Geminicoccaceae bacterium]